MKIILRSLLLLFLASSSTHQLFAQWLETNGPYADNITAFHFTNGLSFAGSYLNGIYRSTDMGNNWVSTSYNFGADVTCFITLNDTIFAGTDHQDVYRSDDSGYNWTRLTNGYFSNERVTSLVVHQGNIYAGTLGNGIFVAEDRTNFIPVTGTLPNSYISSLLSIDNILYAGTNGSGIIRSSDNGASWLRSNTGLSDSTIRCLIYGNGFIFAGTNSGIFRSNNNGESWENANIGPPITHIRTMCLHNGEIFASSNWYGVIRSSNNGESWEEAGMNDISIASLGSSGSSLFAGYAYGLGGMFATTDNGNTWSQQNNGITKAIVRSITSYNSAVFAGTEDAGIFRSTDGGTRWDQINPGMSVFALAVKDSAIYAGTSSGLYRSTDGGEQWNLTGPAGSFDGIYSISTIDSFLFVGTGTVHCYVFRSTDDGTNWTNVLASFPIGGTFSTMCINDTTLFAGALEPSYRTTDYGNTWMTLSGVYSPLSFFAADGIVYVGGDGSGLYRSTDNGILWTQANTGLTSQTVEMLDGTGNFVFAGTFGGGVFKSTNRGNQWINDGLSQNYIFSLHISDTLLYAGSFGVWVRKLDELINDVSEELSNTIPISFSLMQNYPNPFNPTTQIKFVIPKSSFVNLKVFDVLGNEVASLVNEEKPAGSYEVEFSVGQNSILSLSSGIYFYQLRAGSFVETKKMVLMK